MISEIILHNFKSFEQKKIHFPSGFCNIVWDNGVGKTNILQSIWIASWNPLPYGSDDFLHKIGSHQRYIEASILDNNSLPHTVRLAHDQSIAKKVITINGKKTTKAMISKLVFSVVYFSPYDMNLFYLGPKYRREFLFSILTRTSQTFAKEFSTYETILKHRNKVLKYLQEWRWIPEDLDYWDTAFVQSASQLYAQIFPLVEFFQANVLRFLPYFRDFSGNIDFLYLTKVRKATVAEDLKHYIQKNRDRDILLGRTPIGPHVDDFDVMLLDHPILAFASRGELKSVLLELKFLEIEFLKTCLWVKPVVLIDDILSELDQSHLDGVIKKCFDLQIIATSIVPISKENIYYIYL